MAIRARLSPPRQERNNWPWHQADYQSLSAFLLMNGERRMEAENYLAGGYGIRLAIECRKTDWKRFGELATVWQPSRLKGIQVGPEEGTPFLSATQVFDVRPTPRKFLSLHRTNRFVDRFVKEGTILVTRSGTVGRTTLAHMPHRDVLISDDLLRVSPLAEHMKGWIYGYLRSPQAQAMMNSVRYGHIIKHLETSHLSALPMPLIGSTLMERFNTIMQAVINKRNDAHKLMLEGETMFSEQIGSIQLNQSPEIGYSLSASNIFGQRRRLEGCYYTPLATSVLQHFIKSKFTIEPLSELTERIWWMNRFKRVFGEGGVRYISADELFTINPTVQKKIMVDQADHAEDYFVKAGWLVMACSGQVYGLNGSLAIMTKRHEGAFFSHDLVRMIPQFDKIRAGYLLTVLGHPTLGRPLMIRCAYGTSVPHIDPVDVATFPVVRVGEALEKEIADRVELAVALRDEADELEDTLAQEASVLIDEFIKDKSLTLL